MDTVKELPTTPSELIRAALADLHACEHDDRYVVDMDDWHAPITDDRGREVCRVCLVGAVMAQTLGVPRDRSISRSDVDPHDDVVSGALHGLDYFRRGEIDMGVYMLDYDLHAEYEDYEQFCSGAEYDQADPDKFHVRMNRLADYLDSQGL